MFIPKNYVLSSELAQLGNINISNFSNCYKYMEDREITEGIALRYGDSTFLNIKTTMNQHLIPTYIKEIYYNNLSKITNLENHILYSELHRETGLYSRNIKVLSEYNPELVEVAGKQFWKFSENFRHDFQDKVLYVISKKEAPKLLNDKLITGYLNISTTRALTWY